MTAASALLLAAGCCTLLVSDGASPLPEEAFEMLSAAMAEPADAWPMVTDARCAEERRPVSIPSGFLGPRATCAAQSSTSIFRGKVPNDGSLTKLCAHAPDGVPHA